MRPLTYLLPIAAMLLTACSEQKEKAEATATEPEAQATAQAPQNQHQEKLEARIEELEREIESSMQIIDDLQAAVVMEQAKLQDDPNYDQSFLQETLSDQDRERADIKRAEDELKKLQK